MTITVSSRRVLHILIVLAVGMALVSLSTVLTPEQRKIQTRGVARLFNLNSEMSYPAWCSSLGLAASAALLAVCGVVARNEDQRRFRRHWMALALIFAGLSADEIVGLHESLSSALQVHFNLTGFLTHAWVLPAFVGLFFFGLAYLRFLVALAPNTRNGMILAGLVYVGGAAGVEMVNGKIADLYSRGAFIYALGTHVEEFMELCGIALLISVLLAHLARTSGSEGLRVQLTAD